MKKILLSLICLFAYISSFAQTFKYDGLTFEITSDTEVAFRDFADKKYIFTDNMKYHSNGKDLKLSDINIPEKVKYNGKIYSVTSIKTLKDKDRDSKLRGRDFIINRLTIPSTITIIPDHSFDHEHFSTYIHEVVIPSSVESIGSRAFYLCGIKKLVLSKELKSIGDEAFMHNSFGSLEIPEGVVKIGLGAFEQCSLNSVVIPGSVITVGNQAFQFNPYLKKVEILEGVESIGANAFSSCKELTEIIFPKYSLKTIGKFAFSYTGIKEMVIPESVEYCGYGLCDNCDNLELLQFPNVKMTIEGPIGHQERWKYSTPRNPNLKKLILPDLFVWKDPELCASPDNKYYLTVEGYTMVPCFYEENDKNNEIHSICEYSFKNKEALEKKFSTYASKKVIKDLDEWVKKGEFETTDAYTKRVTEENYLKKQKEIIQKYKAEYVREKGWWIKPYELGTYDADQQVYPIYFSSDKEPNFTAFLKVPFEKAQAFKNNFDNIKKNITAKIDIANDYFVVASCQAVYEGKTYCSIDNYVESDVPMLAINLPNVNFSTPAVQKPAQKANPTINVTKVDKTIDTDIPVGKGSASKTFAVIIGNEEYTQVSKVEYAQNDADIFAQYCEKTLGIPNANIRKYPNATYGAMLMALKDIKGIGEAFDGDIDVIFYYAGHGIPDSKGNGYLVPTDADGSQLELCVPLTQVYTTLNSIQARSVIAFMDACFSGAQRGDGMVVTARSVALKVKDTVPQGNCLSITAANGEEAAFPYHEKGHGMFTYFLLEKLHDTNGNVTLGELVDYISTNVKQKSQVVNRKLQTPTVLCSPTFNNWQNVKLGR